MSRPLAGPQGSPAARAKSIPSPSPNRPSLVRPSLASRLPRLLRREEWTLGLVGQSAEDIVRHGLSVPVRWMAPPRGGFIADPWGTVLPDGRLTILAEVLDYRSFKGRLAAATVAPEDFAQAEFSTVVDGPAHLSYPQPLFWDGRWLLYCESWEAQGILVFAAASLEGPWRLETRLLPGVPVVDPTPVAHEGRWYLFFTRQDDGPNSRLRLMHGPSPLGPWQPHASAVVVEGAGGARPAGPLFRLSDGTLVRPGQDCTRTYGGALVLHRVDVLTPSVYRETVLRHLAPPPGPWPDGLHTLCPLDGGRCLIDGKRWVFAPLEPVRAALRRPAARRRRTEAASLVWGS